MKQQKQPTKNEQLLKSMADVRNTLLMFIQKQQETNAKLNVAVTTLLRKSDVEVLEELKMSDEEMNNYIHIMDEYFLKKEEDTVVKIIPALKDWKSDKAPEIIDEVAHFTFNHPEHGKKTFTGENVLEAWQKLRDDVLGVKEVIEEVTGEATEAPKMEIVK